MSELNFSVSTLSLSLRLVHVLIRVSFHSHSSGRSRRHAELRLSRVCRGARIVLSLQVRKTRPYSVLCSRCLPRTFPLSRFDVSVQAVVKGEELTDRFLLFSSSRRSSTRHSKSASPSTGVCLASATTLSSKRALGNSPCTASRGTSASCDGRLDFDINFTSCTAVFPSASFSSRTLIGCGL